MDEYATTPTPVIHLGGAEPDEDTVIMPVVGDRVHYGRGSGHLVGLDGVVVTDHHGPDLPSGLRYVLFDDEEWPNVVAVGSLDRVEPVVEASGLATLADVRRRRDALAGPSECFRPSLVVGRGPGGAGQRRPVGAA